MLIKLKLYNIKERFIEKIGKSIFEAKAEDYNGKIYEKVSLWKTDWPSLNIEDGTEVMAEIKFTEKNGFKNITLYPEKTQTIRDYTNKSGMKAAMAQKQEGIRENMEKKNESIKLAGTMRDATLLTVEWIRMKTLSPSQIDFPPTDEEIKKKWLEWRKFLEGQFEAPF